MKNKSKLEKVLQCPGRLLMNILYRIPFLSHRIDDVRYLKMIYFFCFWKKLNLDNPKTYNEKLQWLKINDRKDIYTTMVDKYEVKKYVSNIIGEEYIIPTLGVWDNFDDIDFSLLPDKFVLKCTHDSGGLVICRDKKKFDIKKARDKINKTLKRNYYYLGREWPYKNVKPRIIAEEYIVDKNNELNDYKYFCFSGHPKMLFIASDRGIDTRFDFYDMNFRHLPFINGHPNSDKVINRPVNFNKMRELASILSRDIPQVRVDFYDVDGKIYFGEMTFFHFSGFVPFEPGKWDKKIGEWLVLPKKNK